MASQIVLTCVPTGKDSKYGYVDLLVTPQLAAGDEASLATLRKAQGGWVDQLLHLQQTNGFKLACNNQSATLQPIGWPQQLKPELWDYLFGDATVGNGYSALKVERDPHDQNSSAVMISNIHVSLKDSNDQLTNFYQTVAFQRKTSQFSLGPRHDDLMLLHQAAITEHGLYDPGVPPMIVRPQLAAQNPTADEILSNRLGAIVNNAVPSGQQQQQQAVAVLYPPKKASDALFALSDRLTLDLGRQLVGPPRDQTPHLVNHLTRLMSEPNDKNIGPRLSSKYVQKPGTQPMDFQERLTLLMSMPLLMEALGLILHFSIGINDLNQLLAGVVQPRITLIGPTLQGLPPLISMKTVTNISFMPQPKVGGVGIGISITDGSIVLTGYHAGSLQLDSAAMQTVQFANRVGMLQGRVQLGNNTKAGNPVLIRDEDVEHPILPPSPHTGGFYVWQEDRQQKETTQLTAVAQTAGDPTQDLYADDLTNSTAIDVKTGSEWIALTTRNETYKIGPFLRRTTLSATGVTRGVHTAAVKRSDGYTQTYDVDETIFTWRVGSLVAPPSHSYKPMKGSQPTSPQQVPWASDDFQRSVEAPDVPPPLFGNTYSVVMRPVYMTGYVPPLNPDTSNTLSAPFQRYELMQGPETIPVKFTERYIKQEGKDLMFVASRLDDKNHLSSYAPNSIRVLVPGRVTPDVARRHGKTQEDITRGADVFPLTKGNLPEEIQARSKERNHATEEEEAYHPDPLVSGVVATLTDLYGNALLDPKDPSKTLSATLSYFDNAWPDYTPHMLELRRAPDGQAAADLHDEPIKNPPDSMPFLTAKSRRIVCNVPAGQTVLLDLRPQLLSDVTKDHAFAACTSAGPNATPEQLTFTDICRPTILRLTHAVDRPTNPPSLIANNIPQGLVAIPISLIDSSSQAQSPLNLQVCAEAMSTSKIEVIATWADQVQDSLLSPPVLRAGSPAQLAEVQIPKKGDPKQFSFNTSSGFVTFTSTAQGIHLPFSDKRYRRLKLQAVAYGRYPAVFNDKKEHTTLGAPLYLDVLATQSPQTPDVDLILPNLRWVQANDKSKKNGFTRTRKMGLTLVLNPPHFTSGNDEQIAVLTQWVADAKNPPSPYILSSGYNTSINGVPANEEVNVSAWGVSPDFVYATKGLSSADNLLLIAGSTSAPAGLKIDINDALQPDTLLQLGTNTYTAALYSPQYNQETRQWYVDIECSTPPCYGTTVRLLVARYQKHAMDGMLLSPVVPCEFVLLDSDRTLKVTRTGCFFKRTVTVQVCGVGAFHQNGSSQAGTLQTSFEVSLAAIDKDIQPGFDWDEYQTLPADSGFKPSGGVLWQGTFTEKLFEGAVVVIREVEIYPCAEANAESSSLKHYRYFDAFRI